MGAEGNSARQPTGSNEYAPRWLASALLCGRRGCAQFRETGGQQTLGHVDLGGVVLQRRGIGKSDGLCLIASSQRSASFP